MSKNGLDVKKIRACFPIMQQQVHGHPLVYLDSAATAQMPQLVIDAIMQYYTSYKANVGRGVYTFAEEATGQYEQARTKIARFINAQSSEIIITSGATAGINHVAQTWGLQHIQQGDEILISEIEHHSNFVPWQQLARKTGACLKIVPINKQGVVDIDMFKSYLSPKTKLVAMIHTSNILGTTNIIKPMIQAAHEAGALFLVDASQSVVHQKVDVQDLGCDFLVFSGHKLFGPTGVGILYAQSALHNELALNSFGGGMVFSVSQEESAFKEVPHSFEAGTQPIAQVIGLGAVIDFIQQYVDYIKLQEHETTLTRVCIQELQKIPGITIMSHVPQINEHSSMVTFSSDTMHAHDIAAYLDQYGIAVRAGNHCVQPFHQKCGINASVRMSFSIYNTIDEVTYAMNHVRALLQ